MQARTIKVAPIRKSLVVKTSADKAFTVFTAEIGRWWPRAFTIGTSPIEGRGHGGAERRALVRARRGRLRVRLGQGAGVGAADPRRPGLADQRGMEVRAGSRHRARGAIHRDRCPGETRVDFEHRKLEALGDAAEAVRAQLESGWPGLLEAYAAEVEGRPSQLQAAPSM